MKNHSIAKHSLALLALFFLVAGNPLTAQKQTEEKARIIKKTEIGYLTWLPGDYRHDRHKKYPLIIFLHGSGERGNDLEKVKAWGPPSFVESRPDFPFIVISPQCPDNQWWDTKDLDQMLSRLLRKYRIDKDRMYLTGLSMGGFGTWQWAIDKPDRFAAIAPVCGGGNPIFAEDLKNLPIWAFHGADDPVVPVKGTTEMVEAINKAGGNAKMTIYPGVGHDSWRNAYADENLYKWFLEHSKK